jgi:hypothetical protein
MVFKETKAILHNILNQATRTNIIILNNKIQAKKLRQNNNNNYKTKPKKRASVQDLLIAKPFWVYMVFWIIQLWAPLKGQPHKAQIGYF